MLECRPYKHEYLISFVIQKISLTCTLLYSLSKLLALMDKSWFMYITV